MGRLRFYIVNDDPKSIISIGPIVGKLSEDMATGSLILEQGPSWITFNVGYAYDYAIVRICSSVNNELVHSTMKYDHKINQATVHFNMPKSDIVISIYPVFMRLIGKGDYTSNAK